MEAADINLSCVSGNYGCLNLSYNSSAWIFGNSSLNSMIILELLWKIHLLCRFRIINKEMIIRKEYYHSNVYGKY